MIFFELVFTAPLFPIFFKCCFKQNVNSLFCKQTRHPRYEQKLAAVSGRCFCNTRRADPHCPACWDMCSPTTCTQADLSLVCCTVQHLCGSLINEEDKPRWSSQHHAEAAVKKANTTMKLLLGASNRSSLSLASLLLWRVMELRLENNGDEED